MDPHLPHDFAPHLPGNGNTANEALADAPCMHASKRTCIHVHRYDDEAEGEGENETNFVRLFDDTTFEIKDSYQLETYYHACRHPTVALTDCCIDRLLH